MDGKPLAGVSVSRNYEVLKQTSEKGKENSAEKEEEKIYLTDDHGVAVIPNGPSRLYAKYGQV